MGSIHIGMLLHKEKKNNGKDSQIACKRHIWDDNVPCSRIYDMDSYLTLRTKEEAFSEANEKNKPQMVSS